MNLKDKRVLITAGPTWVPIDSVRVISNIASGETGILLAEKLIKKQAEVTLVLGPVGSRRIDRRIHLVKFRFFEELRARLKKELSSKNYHIVIHSAAVSDFKPQQPVKGKLKSEKAHTLTLTPLPKIAAEIRRASPSAKLIMFKLEAGISDKELIRRARSALIESGADIMVANKIKPSYTAYILDKSTIRSAVNSKQELIQKLISVIRQKNSKCSSEYKSN